MNAFPPSRLLPDLSAWSMFASTGSLLGAGEVELTSRTATVDVTGGLMLDANVEYVGPALSELHCTWRIDGVIVGQQSVLNPGTARDKVLFTGGGGDAPTVAPGTQCSIL